MKMIGKWSREKKIEIANDINKAKHEEREKKIVLNKTPSVGVSLFRKCDELK